MLAAPDPAPLPRQRHWLHGRLEGGEGRHRQGRREDGACRRMRGRPQAHRRRWRELRRGQLWHVRARIWRTVPLDVAGTSGSCSFFLAERGIPGTESW